MLRSKPLAALLGLVLGFVAAAATRQAWRLLTGQEEWALPIGSGRSPQPSPATGQDVAESPQTAPIAEDEASALRPSKGTPETAEELADLLPEPDLPLAGLVNHGPTAAEPGQTAAVDQGAGEASEHSVGELTPADEEEVDRVLEVLAAETTAREPTTLQSRFGPNAFPPDEGGDCPPEHPVKGNGNSMIYHLPGQSSYGATMAEVCFPDAAAAEAAGFRPRKTGRQTRQ